MDPTKPKLILPGGSGFLGTVLARWFAARGWDIVVLSRRGEAPSSARAVTWDGRTLGDWTRELAGAQAIINLAGRSVNCRYHARNRQLMMDSRIDSTRVLGEAIAACETPPPVWINSSTATIYRHTFGEPHDESGPIGATPEAKDAFSIEVAAAWEREFEAAATARTRKILARTAMVFGTHPGTVYQVLRRLVRFGLGGKAASGRQYVSWIHEDDFCRAMEWLIENPDANGIYNIAAPNPIPNEDMMRLLRKSEGMPFGLPSPGLMLEIGAVFIRTETELVIKSRRVVPGRLLKEGFEFEVERMEEAFERLKQKSA